MKVNNVETQLSTFRGHLKGKVEVFITTQVRLFAYYIAAGRILKGNHPCTHDNTFCCVISRYLENVHSIQTNVYISIIIMYIILKWCILDWYERVSNNFWYWSIKNHILWNFADCYHANINRDWVIYQTWIKHLWQLSMYSTGSHCSKQTFTTMNDNTINILFKHDSVISLCSSRGKFS